MNESPIYSIMVVGDIMLDKYILGEVTRISPEAPVPIILDKVAHYRLGGAAKVASLLKKEDTTVFLCGLIGKDEEANIVCDLLEKQNIVFLGIEDSNAITTTKTRFYADAQQLFRYDTEKIRTLKLSDLDYLINYFKKGKWNALVLSDYNKGVLSLLCIEEFKKIALEKNIPIFVDPKEYNIDLYRDCTLLKLNKLEFDKFIFNSMVIKNNSPAEFERTLKYAVRDLNLKYLIVTSKSNSISCVDKEGNINYYYVESKIQKSDSVGAGDAFLANLVLGYLTYNNMESAIKMAEQETSKYLQNNNPFEWKE